MSFWKGIEFSGPTFELESVASGLSCGTLDGAHTLQSGTVSSGEDVLAGVTVLAEHSGRNQGHQGQYSECRPHVVFVWGEFLSRRLSRFDWWTMDRETEWIYWIAYRWVRCGDLDKGGAVVCVSFFVVIRMVTRDIFYLICIIGVAMRL